jgi:hypothetical protein
MMQTSTDAHVSSKTCTGAWALYGGSVRWPLFLLLSPTRLAYECLKFRTSKKTAFKRRWPRWALVIEIVLIGLALLPPVIFKAISIPVLWIAISRIIEITYAYYNDGLDKALGRTRDPAPTSGEELTTADRLQFAAKSYASLIINWALFYFALPFVFHTPLILLTDSSPEHLVVSSIWDFLYFSGVSITTLGYGDLIPYGRVIRLLSVCETLSGMIVLVFAFAIYLTVLKPKDRV